jgi:hypothetical protein
LSAGISYYALMSAFKHQSAGDRIAAAANAKKAMLEKFKAKPPPDDPAVLERQAAQKAILEAREARAAERRAARDAEAARIAAEKAALVAEQERQAIEQAAYLARKANDAAAAQAEYKARALALAAEQKAARDLRYAKRKAR